MNNKTNNRHFQTIVIGSGTSAKYALTDLLDGGQTRLAIIDAQPFGGTCALRGCQPKMFLVANAAATAAAAQLTNKGIRGSIHSDWRALQQWKNEHLAATPDAERNAWQAKGVETFRERAQLSGLNQVTLLQSGTVLTADHIVLATGSQPRQLSIPGAEHIRDSNDFLNLAELPPRIVFIGIGYISMEFAHVAARAGSDVTLVHSSSTVLRKFERNVVDAIVDASKEHGIKFQLGSKPRVVHAPNADGTLRLELSTGVTLEADCIVATVGRVPNVSALDGGLGQVQVNRGGIAVNEFLQSTSNPHVYAIGDCCDVGAMLATVGDGQGKLAAHNILNNNSKRVDESQCVPTAMFTVPSLATVGLSEAEAQAKGLQFEVKSGSTADWPSSKRIGEKHGAFKVLVDTTTNCILGAHLTRFNAGELINVFALAIAHQISVKQLEDFLWAYPTSISDIRKILR